MSWFRVSLLYKSINICFLSFFLVLFTYLGRIGPKKKFQFLKMHQCCRVCAGVLPIFAVSAPPPLHPDVAGWCRFVVGCLLDGFCINNKGFSTVGGHWSQRVNKTPTSVRFTVATADPSWVCNGAGGGISGGKKHKLNILLTPVGSISICSLPKAQMGNIGAV